MRSLRRFTVVAMLAGAANSSQVSYADPEVFNVAALGDSITRAFNAYKFFADSPEVSWSTGTKKVDGFQSHLQRLIKLYPYTKVNDHNLGATGAVAKDLYGQVQKAIAVKADYVTLLIGANDVCHWSSDYQDAQDHFVATVGDSLETLIAANDKVKIVVSSMPNVYHVWEVSHKKLGCQAAWDTIGLCKPLLARKVKDHERLAFRDRWDHTNDRLGALASSFPKNVRFSQAAADYQFEDDDISRRDCFHPSLKGQSLLAEAVWHESWFADGEPR